ncbi:MAG: hypothetical protein HQK64_13215 [Desulfamplus sp.]|nr:hypothetical protein [Desulfamplus sp.]
MKTLISSLFLIFFLAITLYLQSNLIADRFTFSLNNPDCPWCDSQNIDDVQYLPVNSISARLFAPADPDFISDMIWLRTCYYFGSHALTDKKYDYLLYLLNLITDLSPKWEHPYSFGAIALFLEADAPFEAMSIIEKGIANLPNVWEFHFFSGYILWQHFKDMEAASLSLLKASKIEGAPKYLAGLAATFASKTDNSEFINNFIDTAMDILDNPLQKQVIQNKIIKNMEKNHD